MKREYHELLGLKFRRRSVELGNVLRFERKQKILDILFKRSFGK